MENDATLEIKFCFNSVMNGKVLSVMHYQDDINTEHNMKSVCRAAVAQWTKRLTHNGQTRVQNRKGANIFFTFE